MAAIDKLYVSNYYDYDYLRRWAMAYYPELLMYFYDVTLDFEKFSKNRKDWIDMTMAHIERDHARLGEYDTIEKATQNIIDHYKKTADYDCPWAQALDEAEKCIENHMLIKNHFFEDLVDDPDLHYEFPVMSTPLSVDRKLKWICPVPCVRDYLKNQCGVSGRWEWLYRIFWRGKKHF